MDTYWYVVYGGSDPTAWSEPALTVVHPIEWFVQAKLPGMLLFFVQIPAKQAERLYTFYCDDVCESIAMCDIADEALRASYAAAKEGL